MSKFVNPTKVITGPKTRWSYANVWEHPKGLLIHRMNTEGLKELYQGHEIAAHCLTHADLPKYDEETIRNEILEDKKNLEERFGLKE